MALDLLPHFRLYHEIGQFFSQPATYSLRDIAEELQQRQAAGKLGQKLVTSQSAITKAIDTLEDYFGVKLVNRSPGQAAQGLTDKGRKVWQLTCQFFDKEVAVWVKQLKDLHDQ